MSHTTTDRGHSAESSARANATLRARAVSPACRSSTAPPFPPRPQSVRTAVAARSRRLATAHPATARQSEPSEELYAPLLSPSPTSCRLRERNDAITKATEIHPLGCRRLRDETRPGHARRRVRLQAKQLARGCHTEVNSRTPVKLKCAKGKNRQTLRLGRLSG